MTSPVGPQAHPGPPAAVCVRHPDRATALACTRCGRPACTECLREASVGYQCVDCVRDGARDVPRGRTVAGASAPRGRPLVVLSLIAVNVVVFLLCVVQARQLFEVTDSGLVFLGALWPDAVAAGQWWRIVTGGFLHFGLLHVALNMVALWMLGSQLEPVLGRGRLLAVYGLSLLGGSAAVMLFDSRPTIGASGAVFGLMGAFAVILLRLRQPLSAIVPTILINAVISIAVPGISLAGHAGGLVAGALATAAIVYAPRGNARVVQAAGLTGLGVVLLGLCALGAAYA